MNWWGKLLGGTFGFMVGGPLGAVLGAALGHNIDKSLGQMPESRSFNPGHQHRVQTAFFTASFSVMGHICKADGRVSRDEIDIARRIMQQMDLSSEQKKTAMGLFNAGKQPDFPLRDVLEQFNREVGHRYTLKRMFVEIQCFAAWADTTLHPVETRLLHEVCEIIRVNRAELEQLLAAIGAQFHHQTSTSRSSRPDLTDAYKILQLDRNAGEAEIKKAYRRLISQHHPDKLVAKGLPEEMVKLATERTREIRQAYEAIKEHKGF